uniref:Olfactomedin like 2B n=1 Tax=Hucho hucho TaxID=62062 RepID=A0A4W5L9A3_9TELE
MDNQENVLTQLLGDYDKVKTLSEGSDCRCKCVVRPLSRSACRRIEEGAAKAEDFYTVETVTSGPNCKKCACIAPPSALNPCEGDYRFKKLQEAGKDDIKLSTVMELLEGAFYGMDLLKLHSVTTKLLNRVDNIEKTFSCNHMEKDKVSVRSRSSKEKEREKERRAQQRMEKRNRLTELEPSLQKDTAAAYANTEKKYEERYIGAKGQGTTRPMLKRSQPQNREEPQGPLKGKVGLNGMVIRGVTFYKANTVDDGAAEELTADEALSGDGSMDLLFDDQLLRPTQPRPVTATETPSITVFIPTTTIPTTTTTAATTTTTMVAATASTTQPATTRKPETLSVLTTSPTAAVRQVNSTIAPPSKVTGAPKPKHRISWTEGPSEVPSATPGMCKDTLASISDPVTHNTYGRKEGAWMKDPKGNGNVIYVTNYYYGNHLLEFHDMDNFKQGHFTNSYKLPYNWIGTGHVVYSGAFYYNRAFSRDIIKFDLHLLYVAAWTTLHDAMLEEEDNSWRWRGHSDIDFAVDESGLWLVYPALDEEGFHQEVIILSRVNPNDLSLQSTFRTGLRRHFYGNSFVICGVLYAVDNYERTHANISYAFDTHTHTQMIPRIPFTNNYTYTTQIDYNPKDKKLYAWDNGHQVTYNVIFAY